MASTTRNEAHGECKAPDNQRADALAENTAKYKSSPKSRYGLTQLNSAQSPLLRLPAEIRNEIWAYSVGGRELVVRKKYHTDSYNSRPQGDRDSVSRLVYGDPVQLHKVCKQIHAEVTSLIYDSNTFCFYDLEPIDRWTGNRSFHQLQLITSIRVPFQYFQLYTEGFRKGFREQFPNLKKLSMNEYTIWHVQRMNEPTEECKARLVQKIREREGEDLLVDWYAYPEDDLPPFSLFE